MGAVEGDLIDPGIGPLEGRAKVGASAGDRQHPAARCLPAIAHPAGRRTEGTWMAIARATSITPVM